MLFKKNPIVIEAERTSEVIDRFQKDSKNLPDWIKKAITGGILTIRKKDISVDTLEGYMIATPDTWIIQGIDGEIYPCQDYIFKATYKENKRKRFKLVGGGKY